MDDVFYKFVDVVINKFELRLIRRKRQIAELITDTKLKLSDAELTVEVNKPANGTTRIFQ